MISEDRNDEAIKAQKEAQLNARMEQIRKRNAQLEKRYEEVKADKMNAETSSNEFNERRRCAPVEEKNKAEDRVSVKSRLGPVAGERQPPRQPRTMPAVIRKKTDIEDGPPPDPKYSFLADRSRDTREDHEQDKERRENSRRHPSNYGGKDFENVKTNLQRRKMREQNSYRGSPRKKMEMSLAMTGRERREYEAWRVERSEIESARLNRQKTSSGQWRREWDQNKNIGSSSVDETDMDLANRDAVRSNRGGRHREGDRYDRPPSEQHHRHNFQIRVDSDMSKREIILPNKPVEQKIDIREVEETKTRQKDMRYDSECFNATVDKPNCVEHSDVKKEIDKLEEASQDGSWADEGSWEDTNEEDNNCDQNEELNVANEEKSVADLGKSNWCDELSENLYATNLNDEVLQLNVTNEEEFGAEVAKSHLCCEVNESLTETHKSEIATTES